MYTEYFGLSQPPFRITPDTNLFYSGGNRGAILEALIYAITNGEGIVKVVGEVGTGKTMLCRMLEVELTDNIEVVYLANPSLEPNHIPYAIAFELKLDIAADSNRLQVMNELQNYLLQKHRENGQVVVFVEEAQSMPIASLEELRLLSNLETGQSKLLQIVLFGQPELDERIATTDIRQLKERITYSFQLGPFKTPDIREYLNARVRACGYRGGELFTSGSIREIARYSNGLLRRVNILADKSLLSAYATNTDKVKAKHVKVAARDSEFISGWKRFRWPMLATACLILILAGAAVMLNQGLIPMRDMANPLPMSDGTDTSGADQVKTTVANQPGSTAKTAETQTITDEQPSAGTQAVASTAMPETREPDDIDLSLGPATPISTTIEDEGMSNTRKPKDGASAGSEDISTAGAGALTSKGDDRADDELLALDRIIQQQELGEIRYSEKELTMMLQQLEKIPSESYMDNGDEGEACENCASLIYRPLYQKENL